MLLLRGKSKGGFVRLAKIHFLRRYLDWLKERLGYKTWSDLYKVSYNDFASNFGAGLLSRHHKSSASSAVMAIYAKDYDWLPWKFRMVPHGWWFVATNQRYFCPRFLVAMTAL